MITFQAFQAIFKDETIHKGNISYSYTFTFLNKKHEYDMNFSFKHI